MGVVSQKEYHLSILLYNLWKKGVSFMYKMFFFFLLLKTLILSLDAIDKNMTITP